MDREVPASTLLDHLLSDELTDAGSALRGLHVFAATETVPTDAVAVRTHVRRLLREAAGRV